ncbi:MAG: NMD3-related protein [Thermoplasmatota archaeon]
MKCGKNVDDTIDGLCSRCYVVTHQLFDIPAIVDVTICPVCDRCRVDDGWQPETPDRLLQEHLEAQARTAPVHGVSVHRDGTTVTCQGTFKGEQVTETMGVDIRMHKEMCQRCSRLKGGYFEAVLQVRKNGGDISPEERDRADDIVARQVIEKRDNYVSRRVEHPTGVDYYIGDRGSAQMAAKHVKQAFNATMDVSSSLIGRKDGQDVYRDTILVRIPAYRRGSYVALDDTLYRVTDTGKRVGLLDLRSGMRRPVYDEDMEAAAVVNLDPREAVVLSRQETEIQVLDPETYETVVLAVTESMAVGETVDVVRWNGRLYLADR